MSYTMPGNNFNQRGTVHLSTEICRTIIGGGALAVTTPETNRK